MREVTQQRTVLMLLTLVYVCSVQSSTCTVHQLLEYQVVAQYDDIRIGEILRLVRQHI